AKKQPKNNKYPDNQQADQHNHFYFQIKFYVFSHLIAPYLMLKILYMIGVFPDRIDSFITKHIVNKAPRFKSKNNPVQSYTTKYTNGNIAILGNIIKLPKLGFVRFAKSREVDGRIISATIRRNPSGKYFISILVETEVSFLDKTNKAVGIDLGITDFAILSTGEKLDNNQFTAKMLSR